MSCAQSNYAHLQIKNIRQKKVHKFVMEVSKYGKNVDFKDLAFVF